MMDKILNIIRREIQTALSKRASFRYGIVSAYNPEDHTAKVKIQPQDVETGWLMIGTHTSGDGNWIVPVKIGSQVHVDLDALSDNGATGVIRSVFFDDIHTVPKMPREIGGSDVPMQSGEAAFTSGNTVFRIGSYGIYSRGNWFVDGNIKSSGNIEDKTSTLDSLRQDYNGHVHSGVRGGTESTQGTSKRNG